MDVALEVFQPVRGSLKVVLPRKTPLKLVTLSTHQFPMIGPYFSFVGDEGDGFSMYSVTAAFSNVLPVAPGGKHSYG
jgi:hypothetical protein